NLLGPFLGTDDGQGGPGDDEELQGTHQSLELAWYPRPAVGIKICDMVNQGAAMQLCRQESGETRVQVEGMKCIEGFSMAKEPKQYPDMVDYQVKDIIKTSSSHICQLD